MHIPTMRLPGASRLALGLGSLALTGFIAGCGHGGGGGGASPSASADPYQQAVKYSQCMRAHGVNIPDPQTGGNGGPISVKITPGAGDAALNPDSAKFQDAQNACKSLLPNGGDLSPEQQAQAQANALKFAQCMRAHGVDVPDPKPGNGGLVIQGGSASGNGNTGGGPVIRPDDPNFQAAQKACEGLLGNPVGSGLQTANQGG